MYQQPIINTLSTGDLFRNFNEEAKLTAHDALMTLAEVAGVLGSCWMLHVALS